MTLKENPKTSQALSIKVPLVMLAGSDSPSWYTVLMGHWSVTSSATIVKTPGIQKTTVSALTIKLCVSCSYKNGQ